MIQFIETVILYQFPHWSRQEIEKMLQVSDVRETRVFQEALEEGIEKGVTKGREAGREEGREEEREAIALKMLAVGHSIDSISEITGLKDSQIRTLKRKKSVGSKKSKR